MIAKGNCSTIDQFLQKSAKGYMTQKELKCKQT